MGNNIPPDLENKNHDPREPPPEVQDEVYKKITWRLVPLLFICYVVNQMDRTNIGFAHLQMRPQLGFSDAVYGLAASLFFVGYILFEIPSNLLLARVGARKTIFRIMVLWGIASAMTSLVTTPLQFYAARFLLGIFEAGFFPGILLYLTFWYPRERRGTVIAMFMTAVAVAGIGVGPLSGWVIEHLDDVRGLRGWQWMFVLEGLPSIALGAACYVFLADTPATATWLSAGERALVRSALVDRTKTCALGGSRWSTLADYKLYLFAFAHFGIGCAAYTMSYWKPSMILALGIDEPFQIGLLTAVPYAFAACVAIWYAHHSDRTNERRSHFALAAFVGAGALVLTTWTQTNVPVSIALISLSSAGIISSYPVFWAAVTAHFSNTSAVVAIPLVALLGSLSGVVAPYAVGLTKTATGTMSGGLYVVGGVMVLGGIAMMFAANRPERPNGGRAMSI